MKTSTIVWIVIIIIIVLGGGWYLYSQNSGANSAYSNQTNTTTSTTNTAATPMLTAATSATLGSYLVATNGMTLYKYSPDTSGVSTCTGQCAAVWPPYAIPTGTSLVAMSGISGTLATITRSDGTMQLTYNGMPLYFYTKDAAPGDTNGQGVGGVWSVVAP